MPVLSKKTRILFFEGRGAFGSTKGFKAGVQNYNDILAMNKYAGTYQIRRYGKKRVHIVEKLYKPYNPRTETQQAWRARFQNAVIAYKLLSPDDLLKYKRWGATYKMSGYNKFISEYLKIR